MHQMNRYAVYFSPRDGAFAQRTAEWLGWNPETGHALPQPVLAGIGDPAGITKDPRRYGFHGTIRAPFRPAPLLSLLRGRGLRVEASERGRGVWGVEILGPAAPEVMTGRWRW